MRHPGWTVLIGVLIAALAPLVCSAQTFPPPQDSAAKVISLSGSVSILKDNNLEWALSIGDAVQVRQIIVSGPDGHAVFQVSDGSTFEVFPNSHVTFRKNPPNWRDLIDVMVGRVKIHIQKWGNQPNPNRIYTPTAVISVRGTTFDVSVNEEDESTVVEVEEGQVAVQHALLPRGDARVVNAGESLTVYKTQPLEAHLVDKGTVVQHVLRALVDAVSTSVPRTGRTGTGTGVPGTTGGGTVGDTGRPPAPPPPPPPPGPPQ